MSSDEAKYPNT